MKTQYLLVMLMLGLALAPTAEAHDDHWDILIVPVVWTDASNVVWVNITAQPYIFSTGTDTSISSTVTAESILHEHWRNGASDKHIFVDTNDQAMTSYDAPAAKFYKNQSIGTYGATTWLRGVTAAVTMSWTDGIVSHSHTNSVFISPFDLYVGSNLFYNQASQGFSYIALDPDGNTTSKTDAAATYESQAHANATWCPIDDCVTSIDGENFVTNGYANATFEGQQNANDTRDGLYGYVNSNFCAWGQTPSPISLPGPLRWCPHNEYANSTWESQQHANDTWCPLPCVGGSGDFVTNDYANATFEGQEHANATWCPKDFVGCHGNITGHFTGDLDGSATSIQSMDAESWSILPYVFFIVVAVALLAIGAKFGAFFGLIGGVVAFLGMVASWSDASASAMLKTLLILVTLLCFIVTVAIKKQSVG